MNPNESETPLEDAIKKVEYLTHLNPHGTNDCDQVYLVCQEARRARTLEKDLNDARRELEQHKEYICAHHSGHYSCPDCARDIAELQKSNAVMRHAIEAVIAAGRPHGGVSVAYPDGCECELCEAWDMLNVDFDNLPPTTSILITREEVEGLPCGCVAVVTEYDTPADQRPTKFVVEKCKRCQLLEKFPKLKP